MEDMFYKELSKIISNKNFNNVYIYRNEYDQIVKVVSQAKLKKHSKTSLDYRRLKRYDVLKSGKDLKLISPIKNEGDTIRYFVAVEDMFEVIHTAHLTSKHGGRTKTKKEIANKYKNVTAEAIMLYLNICETCQQKTRGKEKGPAAKPFLTNDLNSRCQVDLIDLQTQPDNEFKFILQYQDALTKFVVLRPLRTKSAKEIAEQLLEIFALIGAPSILQSEDGRALASEIVSELTLLWDGIKMVHGLPVKNEQESAECATQEVENLLQTWMLTNRTTKWSNGLKFVQLTKNRLFHEGIMQSPYEAMFGSEMKLGLKSANMPEEMLVDLQSEEELMNLINIAAAEHATEDEDAHFDDEMKLGY